MTKRITIVTGQHLTANPRVWKEANALASHGYLVTIYTTWYNQLLITDDRKLILNSINYFPSFSLIYSWRNILLVISAKGIKKLANYFFRCFNVSSIYQEVYLPRVQLNRILAIPADLFICHQEAGLLLGVQLLKKGKKVAFDFEDWYAEESFNKFRSVDLFRVNERYALNHAAYITCPSKTMSISLKEYYKLDRQVTVVFNSFPIDNIIVNNTQIIPNSMVWFSQTIGPGRGIEAFLIALREFTAPVEIHLVGNCSNFFLNQLIQIISNTPHKVFHHPLCKHNQLMQLLQKFRIGLVLELDFPLNRRYTITNKILTYLQLNMYVLATKTCGNLELKDSFEDRIAFVDIHDPKDIITKLSNLLTLKDACSKNYNFPYEYTWDSQEKKLISLMLDNVISV
jgi:hypothetical protein